MGAPVLTVAETDLIKVLDPAAAVTRASYSRMRRPWTPGYRAKAEAADAAVLAGFNAFHPDDGEHVNILQGVGAAAGATVPSYALPSGTELVLPETDTLTTALAYLDAVCLIYAPGDRNNAILVERVATDGADVTRQFWRIDDASTISIAYAYAAGPLYSDIPAGWCIEIQVPPAAGAEFGPANIWSPAAAGITVVDVKDFMAATTAAITLNRIFK